ncbi:MAG: acyltransferase [Erysipelotrichaceae bacterium]|nr:acyltransferase [Erysipelotrichaceae bacterium]
MPILFIVSGITSRLYLESHSDREFIRSRTTKLLVPSTIGLFVFQFIQGYINMSLSNALDQMAEAPWFVSYLIMAISGQGVLWFAQMLWLFSVILVGVRKLEKDRGWQLGKKVNLPILLLLTGAVWLSAQSGNTPVVVVYRFGLYNTLYFLGYFIFSHQEVMEVVKKNFWLFLALALSLGVVFCFYSFGKNYADEPVYRSVLFTSYSWLGCLAILGGFGRYFDFETGFTRWMSRHSFGLYIFHYLGISAVALFMAKPELLAPLSVYLISTLAGFAVGYLLPMIIARLPFISWAVLGIKRKG